MEREQPIVARDFLGLGEKIGENPAAAAEAKNLHGDLHGRIPVDMFPKVHENSADRMTYNGSGLFNPFSGMKHPVWNKAAVMQRFMHFRDFQEERFLEQSAENAPEGSSEHEIRINPLPDQKVQQGNFSMTAAPPTRDDLNVPQSRADPNALGSMPVAGEARLTSNGPMEKHGTAPLTIFYGGSVNVFNDVSVEKAHAIMLLACGHNAGITGKAVTSSPDKSHLNGEDLANQTNYTGANFQFNFTHPASSVPSSPLPAGQPVVPRALPQARKASLARFLEKRRERLQSKSPYTLMQEDSSFPEERLSSSNDIFAYKTMQNVDMKKKPSTSNWMEMISENFISDVK